MKITMLAALLVFTGFAQAKTKSCEEAVGKSIQAALAGTLNEIDFVQAISRAEALVHAAKLPEPYRRDAVTNIEKGALAFSARVGYLDLYSEGIQFLLVLRRPMDCSALRLLKTEEHLSDRRQ